MPTSIAVRIHQTGGPEQLRVETVEVPNPGPGEALLRHTAIGVNFTDIHHRSGRYPGPGLPMTLGMEAAVSSSIHSDRRTRRSAGITRQWQYAPGARLGVAPP